MIDAQRLFSDAQAVVVTIDSTTTIDLGALVDDRGTALTDRHGTISDMWVYAIVNTAFTGGTNIVPKMQDSSDDSTFADVPEVVNAAVVLADLDAIGDVLLKIKLPKNVKRYIKLVYTVTGTMSAGKIDAGLAYSWHLPRVLLP
ncbi:hypothetical protein LCGC14_0359620 [marine sediment metagenome]|uniref:Uncharacterized protein n=1 Tax=marine sediment metagenome TaxID=412755 RepID=A0A0F9TRH2_9ZZZZ|nr:hypothetical protein [Candidatus Aminicenantes bacterium]